MKTYRSLLCLSTKNHNILYFLNIPGTNFPNKGICLWKASKLQAGRGFGPPNLPQSRCNPPGGSGRLALRFKPSPWRNREQGTETVQFGIETCADVDNRGRERDVGHGRKGCDAGQNLGAPVGAEARVFKVAFESLGRRRGIVRRAYWRLHCKKDSCEASIRCCDGPFVESEATRRPSPRTRVCVFTQGNPFLECRRVAGDKSPAYRHLRCGRRLRHGEQMVSDRNAG
jgi:hypothetical protein